MPRVTRFEQIQISAQRELASKRYKYITIDNDGTVMPFGVRIEYAFENWFAEASLKNFTAVEVTHQQAFSLQDNQGADPLPGQVASNQLEKAAGKGRDRRPGAA